MNDWLGEGPKDIWTAQGSPEHDGGEPARRRARTRFTDPGTEGLYTFAGSRRQPALVTEYEQLLRQMIDERKEKIEALRGKKGKEKELRALLSDLRFVEVEMHRYQQGMSLFRSKGLPKVGRWGQPEAEEHAAEQTKKT